MNISITTGAFGAVVLGGLVLFATGTPADHGAVVVAAEQPGTEALPGVTIQIGDAEDEQQPGEQGEMPARDRPSR